MYMGMAAIAAQRSSCARKKVGAIITDSDMRNIFAVGYNGPPRHTPNECPGDASVAGGCGCIHAETNALLKAPFDQMPLTLFVTLSPCIHCARLITNSYVTKVIYRDEYRTTEGLLLLAHAGIQIEKIF